MNLKTGLKALIPLLLVLLLVLPAWAADAPKKVQEKKPPAPVSLRSNPEDFEPVPLFKDPQELLSKYAPFKVEKREDKMEVFPCTDCHDNEEQKTNYKVRELTEEHESVNLVHGGGRFWCLACHDPISRDKLRSIYDQPISFNQSFLLCGQCHFQRQKDVLRGGHGKRYGNWNGERTIKTCVECHNPHVPMITPRNPVAYPKVRTGLKPMVTDHHASEKPWEKYQKQKKTSTGQPAPKGH